MKSIYSICIIGNTIKDAIDDDKYNNINHELENVYGKNINFNVWNISYEQKLFFRCCVEVKIYTEAVEELKKIIDLVLKHTMFKVVNFQIRYIEETKT